MKYCEAHAEMGIDKEAIGIAYGQWLCDDCIQELAAYEGAERRYQAQYAYASGYHD